jgi:selenocysteine-specific elongation factor
MIVATAGHIDHGKTLLVKAITGVDTDRLPEEKSRGMTIDLGFAYWQAGPARIGFVDVPGHERFVRNMLAGVAGIDFVLLVVAADDGVMPQSREHAAIVELLGVTRGAVALTKIDRVDAARAAAAAQEVTALLAGTALAAAPILPVSAVTGAGIEALKAHLADAARTLGARARHGNFRLAIDRAFTIAGAGIVVTGAVYSGAVAVGERVRILGADKTARVRAIHAQNREAGEGNAGERCALNLAGTDLALDRIERGQWVVAEGAPDPVARLDLRLRVLASEPRPLAHWTPVHAHVGAASVTGRVALLDARQIAPGGTGLAQLALDRPLGAVRGDRVIVRDQSAQRTIGGGTVIDIFPPRRGRAQPARLARLRAMEQDDAAALAALLQLSPQGLELEPFVRARNLTREEEAALLAMVPHRRVEGMPRLAFAPEAWRALKAAALAALDAWHRRAPGAAGPGAERLMAAAGQKLARHAAAEIAAELVADGAAVREGASLRLTTHQPGLGAAEAALWRKAEPLLAQAGLRPPSLHELAQAIPCEAKALEAALARAARLGLITRVAPNRFFLADTVRRLAAIAAAIADEAPQGRITAAQFRDRAGVGRNVAIELLEYFDRVKFTRRIGDAHTVAKSVAEAFPEG